MGKMWFKIIIFCCGVILSGIEGEARQQIDILDKTLHVFLSPTNRNQKLLLKKFNLEKKEEDEYIVPQGKVSACKNTINIDCNRIDTLLRCLQDRQMMFQLVQKRVTITRSKQSEPVLRKSSSLLMPSVLSWY